jgi:hypothetical protein
MSFLTWDNFIEVCVLLLTLERFLVRIAPLTETKKDDELVATLKQAREWVQTYSPLIFGIVEDLAATGKIPAARKAWEYLERLRHEWSKMNPGKPLPEAAEIDAKLIASGLAASTPHGNPTPGPTPK